MRAFLACIGVVTANLIVSIFTSSKPAQWVIASVFGLLVYWIYGLIKYFHSTPKQILAFHGPDSPITRTNSENEIWALISYLRDGGLLVGIELPNFFATEIVPDGFAIVNKYQWDDLVYTERFTFAQIAFRACQLTNESTGKVEIMDQNGGLLATYLAAGKMQMPQPFSPKMYSIIDGNMIDKITGDFVRAATPEEINRYSIADSEEA